MSTMPLPALTDLPADYITHRLYELRRMERDLLVEFLTYLAELDRRRTYLALGFSSLFKKGTDCTTWGDCIGYDADPSVQWAAPAGPHASAPRGA